MKIKTKLYGTYFIILLITFVVTIGTFNFLSQRYLVNEAKKQLQKEGQLIADTLKKIPLKDTDLKMAISARRELKVAGRFIDSKVAIFNSDRKVIFTNLEVNERRKLLNIINSKKNNIEGYVVARVPVINNKQNTKAYVVLLTQIKDIKALKQIMVGTQILSLTIASLVTLFMGLFFGRSITKPINRLMQTMTNFSIKNYSQPINIKTGDEIEELATCFNNMAVKLKKYNQQQHAFLQNASHELKTPLMSIQGYAEAIKDGVVEGKEVEESLEIIIEESKQLKKVVEEITYLTKMENAEETLNLQKVNINTVINNAIKSIKALADEKKINIVVENNIDYIGDFDEDKLKRAFINILGNCIRYAKDKIVIRVQENNNGLQIKIMDNGIGFKEGEAQKVFDRFYKGQAGGTGIGLAITKAIIEGHHGNITAYNNQPTGAVFEITL